MKSSDNKAASLTEWLEIATEGIAAAGRERITREIETHYTEAVEAQLAKGEPEAVARAKTILALGDPLMAARRFRRSCLTEVERQVLLELLARTGKTRPILNSLLAPVAYFGFMFFARGRNPSFTFDVTILLLFALPIIAFIISRRYRTRSKARLLLLIELALDVLVALAITLFGVEALHNSLTIYVGVAAALIPLCLPKFRILNKSRKLVDDIGDVQGLAG